MTRRLTLDPSQADVHVLNLKQLNLQNLSDYLSKNPKWDSVLAIKPTGWELQKSGGGLHGIKSKTRGKVTLYGLPYSEHSSYKELERFVKFLQPRKVHSTVGGYKDRKAHDHIFNNWLKK